MSYLNLKIAPLTYLTPTSFAESIIFVISSFESVIRGRIGSILITHFIPDLQNFSITLKTDFEGGVPGSTILFIFSLFVVIDHTTKQLWE
jgi:hypothetical protein